MLRTTRSDRIWVGTRQKVVAAKAERARTLHQFDANDATRGGNKSRNEGKKDNYNSIRHRTEEKLGYSCIKM